QSPGDPPGPTSDFEHAHLAGRLALADVAQVGQNLLGHGVLAGEKKALVGPVVARGVDIVARGFACPLVPVLTHSPEVCCDSDFAHEPSLWHKAFGCRTGGKPWILKRVLEPVRARNAPSAIDLRCTLRVESKT